MSLHAHEKTVPRQLSWHIRSTSGLPTCSTGAGHRQTLISVDARKVSDFFGSSHSLVTLPLQIILALVILWRQVRMAFVAGLVLVVGLIPINRLLTWGITTASQCMLRHKDCRLDIMTTLLSNLRSLFMMGWHDVMHMQARLRLREPALHRPALTHGTRGVWPLLSYMHGPGHRCAGMEA